MTDPEPAPPPSRALPIAVAVVAGILVVLAAVVLPLAGLRPNSKAVPRRRFQ